MSVPHDEITNMPSSSVVSYRLQPMQPSTVPIRLTAEQQQVVGNTAARLRVLAGPGTGKTATLVEAVAQRIEQRSVQPEEILVLTFSRRAATELAGRISRRLGVTTRESMVRTFHSYAYSVVRAQADQQGDPSPRLRAAGESDHMVRELLGGHLADGGAPWPQHLQGALSSPAFAAELREVLLRAAGQGLSAKRIVELGRRYRRPEWIAAGRFAREYQQVSDLRQGISGFGVAHDQAELTAAALDALRRDEVVAAEQRRIRRIFVDEYQDVDPAQAALVSMLAAGAAEFIVFGDPDQSIYAFRGAEPTALRDVAVDRTVALTVSRRLPRAVSIATRRLAERLPGTAAHRILREPDSVPNETSRTNADTDTGVGSVEVKIFSTAAREASYVADALRRAHLLDGVPWASMAILLRSPAVGLGSITRACAVAGVPVLVGGRDQVLSAEPVVAALLTVLECGIDPVRLTGELALELLSSPLSGVDALGLRRIRRALRSALPGQGSSADLLAAVLVGGPIPETVPKQTRPALSRMRSLLAIAGEGVGNPAAELVLWSLWQECGLEQSLVATVERGGSAGQRADGALDAVLALFAMAADLAERLPLAGVDAFIAEVRGHQVPDDEAIGRTADAVAVLSAHASKGLEWDVVAVVGLQEGTWPDLRSRGTLLGGQELLDLAADLPPSCGGARLAQERGLFYVATTRSKRSLICTAVLNQDVSPSRFLQELTGVDEDLPLEQDLISPDGRRQDRRGLNMVDLVADLRAAVTDPETPVARCAAAAGHLADLATAGVPGAHPDDWYGVATRTSLAPPVARDAEIRVSPSLIESLNSCALRAVLERRGGRTEPGQAQIEGVVVHAMAHGLAVGVPDHELRSEIDTFLRRQDRLPPWQLDRTRRGLLSMLDAAQAWVRTNHPPRTLIGSELDLDLMVPPVLDASAQGSGTNPIRLVGRVDWLSSRPDGTVVVTDFKTGATVPTRAEAESNPQLAAYQAAIALGAFAVAVGAVPAARNETSQERLHEQQGDERLAGQVQPDQDLPDLDRSDHSLSDHSLSDHSLSDHSLSDHTLSDHSPSVHAGPPSVPLRSGGAELVYLRSGKPKVLAQQALSGDSAAVWLGAIRSAAGRLASPTVWAQENARCERCPVRTSCPLQNEGRQVTR